VSDYETFVAEVASTTNEWLFFKYSIAKATEDDRRLAILGEFLESMRQTVFRQTMFAEFELAIHELVESGSPLTADRLNAIYLDLLKRYHGHDQGVCRIDDLYQVEWAFIPHFHYDYYVYTYATSYVAATAFAQNILDGANGGAQLYIDKLLKAGMAKPPVEILQDAGVDMTTPAPIQATVAAMNEVMDQIEEILDRRGE
jgi:oligoendopeptidase F